MGIRWNRGWDFGRLHWPETNVDLFDPGVFARHGMYGFGVELALSRGSALRCRPGARPGVGHGCVDRGGEVACRTPRQGRRLDAARLGYWALLRFGPLVSH